MAINKSGKPASGEIKYEVKEDYLVATRTKNNGNTEELRLRFMSWNDREPRYDIRPWYKDEDGKEKCAKGVSLSGEELIELGKIIQKLAEED